MDYLKYLNAAIEAVQLVRPEILRIYETGFEIEVKGDNSPVTNADKLADEMIRKYLSSLFPTHAFLTEESRDSRERLSNDFVWIVDPIDGTKDFINKDGEFTTNIALSYKNQIVVGVILGVVSGDIYYATKGGGSFVRNFDGVTKQINVSNKDKDLIAITSRYHLKNEEKAIIEKNKEYISKVITVGASLKACQIASGVADISYRFGSGTKEWDIAPCDLLVKEAGGVFEKPDGTSYTYNRVDVANREGYIMANKKENIRL